MPDDHRVLTGLLPDRSALYGILAEIETLGLDLIELHKLIPGRELPGPDGGFPLYQPIHMRTVAPPSVRDN